MFKQNQQGSFIKEDQLISVKDSVKKAVAEYLQQIFGGISHKVYTEGDLALWTRHEAVVQKVLGVFSMTGAEDK